MRRLVATVLVLVLAGGLVSAQESRLRDAESDLAAGRAAGALRSLDSILAAEPRSGAAWRLRGLALEALGRNEEAITSLRRSWELGRNDIDLVARLARAEAAERRWSEAADLTAAWARGAPERRAELRRAEAALRERAGELERAQILWREVFLEEGTGSAAREAGRLAELRGQTREALAWMRLAADLGMEDENARRRRAGLLAQLGRRDEAAVLLEAALRAREGGEEEPQAAARLELARFEVRTGRASEAERVLRPLFAAAEPLRDVLALGARIAARRGEAGRERALWVAFFSRGGEDREGRRRLGRALAFAGDWVGARPHLAAVAALEDAEADDLALALRAALETRRTDEGASLLRRYVARRGVDDRARRLWRALRDA